jgi:hypothetical protein
MGKRGTFSFRVTEGLREQLEAAARQEHRSVSEEIEHRLARTFSEDWNWLGGPETARLLRMMAVAIQATEAKSGRRWFEDDETFVAAYNAALGAMFFHADDFNLAAAAGRAKKMQKRKALAAAHRGR